MEAYNSDRHVYPANARFYDDPDHGLMIELRADANSGIARPATQQDIETYNRAYTQYQGGGVPPTSEDIAPVLTSLSPDSMPADGAAITVTITGTGFADGRSVVVWDDKDAASVFESDTTLSVEMTGPGVEGVSTVGVRNGDELSNELEFEFTAAETPVRRR